eukprot:5443744-Alexandrium_andersonii.AAC.1
MAVRVSRMGDVWSCARSLLVGICARSLFVAMNVEIACSCARMGPVAPPELALAPEGYGKGGSGV